MVSRSLYFPSHLARDVAHEPLALNFLRGESAGSLRRSLSKLGVGSPFTARHPLFIDQHGEDDRSPDDGQEPNQPRLRDFLHLLEQAAAPYPVGHVDLKANREENDCNAEKAA